MPGTGFEPAVRAVHPGVDAGAAAAARSALERDWSGPGRGYHDLEHLHEVLARLRDLAAAGTGEALEPVVVLAAWFHDVVYEGQPGADEQSSADVAGRVLAGLGVRPGVVQRVRDLVLVTVDHLPTPGDVQAAALCDADLAILAAGPARYARYAAGVRREYRHVPAPAFRAGRRTVLQGLLSRAETGLPRPLFATPAGARWHPAAIANLRAEIADLSG